MKKAFSVAAVFALTASAPARASDTRSDVYFSSPVREVVGRLSNLCMDEGLTVVDSGDTHVLCSKQVSGFKGVLTQLLIGNAYSTTPTENLRFEVAPYGSGSRVQFSYWVETQMAFGQVQRMPLNGSKQIGSIDAALERLSGSLSPPPSATPLPVSSPPVPTSTSPCGAEYCNPDWGADAQRLNFSYLSDITTSAERAKMKDIIAAHTKGGSVDWTSAANEYFVWYNSAH